MVCISIKLLVFFDPEPMATIRATSSSLFRHTPLAVALMGLGTTPAAWSQSAPAPAPARPEVLAEANHTQSTTLAPVTVQGNRDDSDFGGGGPSISKLPADPHDIPQSITIVNKALMQSQGAVSLGDALRNVPGITLGAAEGGQIGNNINLNGFSARTDIYLDGFRDRAQYYRNIFALDAVEILMGPSSMLFGRGSTGGVINQVTKKAQLKPISEVNGAVSTNGLVRSTLDLDRPLSETSAVRIALMAQDGAPTTRRDMTLQDAGIAPSLRLGINTPTEITLSALLQHNNDRADYGVGPLNGAPVPVPRNTVYGFSDDRTKSDVAALNAGLAHRLAPGVSLRSQVAYFHVTTNARETAPQTIGTVGPGGFAPLVPAATSALPLDALSVRLQSHDRLIHDSSLSNQTELTTTVGTGAIRHSLLFGAEVGHDTYENQAYFRNGSCNGVGLNPATGTSGYVACVPVLAPAYGASPANALQSAGNLASGSANELAAYVNDTADLSPQWKAVAGVRYDRYAAQIANSINSSNTPGSTAFPSLDQTVHYTSVRGGLVWQPSMAQAYYVSYSTSFNPSLEQLVSTTGLSQPLPPQTNRAYELGGKIDVPGTRLQVTAAAFQITQDNARSQNSDNTYTATGTIRVNGARAGLAGRLNDRWQVFGGATLLDAEIVSGIAPGTQGMVPANIARSSATLWSTYAVTPAIEVGGGAVYVSSRFANNTDVLRVPGYTRWDATLAWRQPRYDIRLNIFNLFDKHYYDALIPSDGGRAVPGTGATGMLSFTYRM
jgi:catecholate siderophore receptor